MAQRQVTFCDGCDRPESAELKIMPNYLAENGKELCFDCSLKLLRESYGVIEQTPVQHVKQVEHLDYSDAKMSLKSELEAMHDTSVYVVSNPNLGIGQVFSHGTPKRDAEVLANVPGEPGKWFVKILGEMS